MGNNNEIKTKRKIFEVIIIIMATISLGIAAGVGIIFFNISNYKVCEEINLDDEHIKEIIDTYKSIINNYYIDIDKDILTNSAIKGMLDSLGDPYSTYMNDEQTTSFEDRMRGDYQGIGAEISLDKEGNIIILKVFSNSPAETVGIMGLDIIKAVNNEIVTGKTPAEVAALLKGPIDTTVDVTITRGDEEKEFTITRNKIIIPSIQSTIFTQNNKKIGYIKIDIFSNNTYNQFKEAIDNIEDSKAESLIIDVRDNSGGYLNKVSEIISLFLPKNKLIYQLQDKNDIQKIYSFTKEYREYPIVVLINEYSASASEIMAAAFKESYDATIVGVNSFGKGTVQQTFRLDTGGMIKYTIQKWLTPNGNWINEIGITPDIIIEQNEDYYKNPITNNDFQLQKAIEILST